MRRIGIFGGTFDPIHTGHLIIAQEVSRHLNLDKIIFVPVYMPPHKANSNLVDAKDRYNMVMAAIKGNSKFKVSNLEIKRQGRSYSIDTLRGFRQKFGPKASLFLIIGSDTARELKQWKQISDIEELVKFVVVNRPGYAPKNLPRGTQRIDAPQINISSSRIRSLLKKGDSIRYLVPDRVLDYILRKKVYHKKRDRKKSVS